MLIVFSGLPGTGKTTISRAVASELGATYLRIDAIEQAIRRANVLTAGVGPAGYGVANAVAQANLMLGRSVIADCVNPVRASRDGWRDLARSCALPLIEVEVICSDVALHQRRVETRLPDIEGHALPSWSDVLALAYEPWDRPRLIVDSARLSISDAAALVVETCRTWATAPPEAIAEP